MEQDTENKKAHQHMKGTVVSDKMDNSAIVEVKRYVKHPKYSKYYGKIKRFTVHNEGNTYHEGDEVFIAPTRPRSKKKKFTIVSSV